MAYQYHRFAGAAAIDRAHNRRFVECVQVAGGLVQQHKRSIVQEDAHKADALAFAAGQGIAQLRNRGVVSLRQPYDQRCERRCLSARRRLH